jgi:hypothetical protein
MLLRAEMGAVQIPTGGSTNHVHTHPRAKAHSLASRPRIVGADQETAPPGPRPRVPRSTRSSSTLLAEIQSVPSIFVRHITHGWR